MQGFRRAQPLIGMFPWERWHPLIDKEYIQNPFVDGGVEYPPAPRAQAPAPDEVREIDDFAVEGIIHDARATRTRVPLQRETRNTTQQDVIEEARRQNPHPWGTHINFADPLDPTFQ